MTEKNLLQVSIWVTWLFVFLGIVWGIAAGSGMIVFDGIYSLISVGLSYLSLLVLKQVESDQEDERFPFGKSHFEPLLIIFKSLTLMGMCSISAINAISELFSGGRDVPPGPAVVYALISTIGCFLVVVIIKQKNKSLKSGLLQAEQNQWFGDTLLSFGVLAGFSIAYVLQTTSYVWIIPYVDPAMLAFASGILFMFPLQSFWAAARELLWLQPHKEFTVPVRAEVAKIAEGLDAEFKLRMVTIGRELSIEVNFLLSNKTFTVEEMDAIRRQIAEVVNKMDKQHWINVSFTQERFWL